MNPLWSLPIDYKPSWTWDAPHVCEGFQKSIVYFSKLFYFTELAIVNAKFIWLSSVPTFFLLLLTMLTLCRKVPVLNMTSLWPALCLLAAVFWLMLGSSPGQWPAHAESLRPSQVVSLLCSAALLTPQAGSVSGLTRQTPLAPPCWPAQPWVSPGRPQACCAQAGPRAGAAY